MLFRSGEADWKQPLLLLTSHRLIVSKNRLFGNPKADFTISWPEVSAVQACPWHGTYSPLVQLEVHTARGILTLPVRNIHAVEVESAIRSCYLGDPRYPADRHS